MRSLNLKDTFSWTRIWSCPRVEKSLEGTVVHHISSTIIHLQFILGAIPGLFSSMVSYQSSLFTGIMGKKTSKSPEWFNLTIAKLQSCLYVANLRRMGAVWITRIRKKSFKSKSCPHWRKWILHNQNCHLMVFFFVLLLESRNYIAETEIIAERVFFFLYLRYTIAVVHLGGFVHDCLPGESKWGADSGSFLFQWSQQLEFCNEEVIYVRSLRP